MDINVPHGPQKIEILKKLDPLHLKNHKKISLQKVEKRQSYGLSCNVTSAQSIKSAWLIEIMHATV